MTLEISVGIDETITDSDDGSAGTTGIGGIGNRESEFSTSQNRAEAAAQAWYAGSLGAYAEIWKEVEIPDNELYTGGEATISISGSYAAMINSVAGGSDVSITAFVRDVTGSSEILDEEVIVAEHASIIDYWSESDDYSSVELDAELYTGINYELGIAVEVTAEALSTSQGSAVVLTDENRRFEFSGYCEYDSIDVEWGDLYSPYN